MHIFRAWFSSARNQPTQWKTANDVHLWKDSFRPLRTISHWLCSFSELLQQREAAYCCTISICQGDQSSAFTESTASVSDFLEKKNKPSNECLPFLSLDQIRIQSAEPLQYSKNNRALLHDRTVRNWRQVVDSWNTKQFKSTNTAV